MGEQHRDRDLGVEGQALLGLRALDAQPGHRRQGLRVFGVELLVGVAQARRDVANRAASTSMPPRCSMPSGCRAGEPAVGLLAQDGGVERAAAQVVDGDDRALLDPACDE